MTTVTRLPGSMLPWRYALRIEGVDSDTFQVFIAALKRHIPQRERRWDATDKRWLLRDADAVIELLEIYGIDCDCEDEAPERPTTALTTPEALKTLHLLPTAPPFLVEAVYRTLAKRYHPDAGGNTTDMQRINAAMEVLR